MWMLIKFQFDKRADFGLLDGKNEILMKMFSSRKNTAGGPLTGRFVHYQTSICINGTVVM